MKDQLLCRIPVEEFGKAMKAEASASSVAKPSLGVSEFPLCSKVIYICFLFEGCKCRWEEVGSILAMYTDE